MDRLIQKDRFLTKKIFELTENGLRVQEKGLFSSTEYFVDYDDIGIRVLKKEKGTAGWLIAAIISFSLAVILIIDRALGGTVGKNVEIVYFVVAVFCVFIYWLTYQKTFYLVQAGNKNAIEFMYDKPTKQELEDFINSLKLKRREILDNKYGQINSLLPYDQNHQNLMWLLNNDVISTSEFDTRLKELNSKFNQTEERKIGFNLGEN